MLRPKNRQRIRRNFTIKDESMAHLKSLSDQSGVPMSRIIERLVDSATIKDVMAQANRHA